MAVQETEIDGCKIKYWIAQEGKVFRVDAETGDKKQVYNANWYLSEKPTSEILTPCFKQWVADIEKQKSFEENPLNEDLSAELGDELRQIIYEVVKQIRNHKDIDYQTFKDWYKKKFPISIFDVDALSKWLLKRLNKKSFDEVKEYFISTKFEGVD